MMDGKLRGCFNVYCTKLLKIASPWSTRLKMYLLSEKVFKGLELGAQRRARRPTLTLRYAIFFVPHVKEPSDNCHDK